MKPNELHAEADADESLTHRTGSHASLIHGIGHKLAIGFSLTLLPICLTFFFLKLWHWDFTIPLAYGSPGADEIWQLVATKTLLDTGWVLKNPYLGAPDVSTWYGNSGSQTSSLHSILMLVIGIFVDDAVKVQQIYFVVCSCLITISTYTASRLLNVARLPAVAAGLILAFTSFRLHALFFAYLANYIMLPLALVPCIWVLQGNLFTNPVDENKFLSSQILRPIFYQRKFVISAVIIAFTGISDGYYAFFTLLILGFAVFLRIFSGDLWRPYRLYAPFALIFIMFAVVLSVSYPIREYRSAHPNEADQDLMKSSTDAEVYAPTLKLLVAPIFDHRLDFMANLGKKIVETANFNRKFPYAQGAPVTLGTFGPVILASLMVFWLTRHLRLPLRQSSYTEVNREVPLSAAIAIFAVFVLLCSIAGGIGSLVALVYPSIRAYERFPIFLLCLIYVAAAWAATLLISHYQGWKRLLAMAAVIGMTSLILLDQVPRDLLSLGTAQGIRDRSTRFLAERQFVHSLEASLPKEAMVYQYPYSQYLTNNKYYGWGSFGQLRLYLHSKSLKWSNGGAKGAPGENWNERMSILPVNVLLDEMQSVGFRAIVVDRLVLPDSEYITLKKELIKRTGVVPVEDDVARLASWPLAPLPFRLDYGPDFKVPSRLVVSERFDPAVYALPRLVNGKTLVDLLGGYNGSFPLTLTISDHPELFFSGDQRDRGFGQTKIGPIDDMDGDLICEAAEQRRDLKPTDTISLRIHNRSAFDWKFGSGSYPLYIGVHFFDEAGRQQKQETNLPVDSFLQAGGTSTVSLRLGSLLTQPLSDDLRKVTARFAFVQSGNAWFSQPGNAECSVGIDLN